MASPLLRAHPNLNHRSLTSDLLHRNGSSTVIASPKLEISDIEMIAFQSKSYTSLRDIIPVSPTKKSSWYEVPIKNPLVKHAAIAYLQPMSTPPDLRRRGLLARLRDALGCSDDGCLWWLRDAVLRFVAASSGNSEEEEDEEDDDDETPLSAFQWSFPR